MDFEVFILIYTVFTILLIMLLILNLKFLRVRIFTYSALYFLCHSLILFY